MMRETIYKLTATESTRAILRFTQETYPEIPKGTRATVDIAYEAGEVCATVTIHEDDERRHPKAEPHE